MAEHLVETGAVSFPARTPAPASIATAEEGLGEGSRARLYPGSWCEWAARGLPAQRA